jgi:hypothetical protein
MKVARTMESRRHPEKLKASGVPAFEIRAEAFATLNGRPSQRLVDPEANLAKQPVFAWIIPIAASNEHPLAASLKGRGAQGFEVR